MPKVFVLLVEQALIDELVEHRVGDAELFDLRRVERPAELGAQPLDRRLQRGLEPIRSDFAVTDAGDDRIGRTLILKKRRAGEDAPTDKCQDQQAEQRLDDDTARPGADCLQHEG
jgi:hypothetical protein